MWKGQAGEMAQWVRVLGVQAWGFELNSQSSCVRQICRAHVCNPNTPTKKWEEETGESPVAFETADLVFKAKIKQRPCLK